jgi:GST-like protein|eukprot:SAG25_NODE_681_length_5951_cov_1.849795_7_plen_88_part_00
MVGGTYTIADMACFPWVQTLRGKGYDREGQPRTTDFLTVGRYANVNRWADAIMARPATYRGMRVCAGKPKPWLASRGVSAATGAAKL